MVDGRWLRQIPDFGLAKLRLRRPMASRVVRLGRAHLGGSPSPHTGDRSPDWDGPTCPGAARWTVGRLRSDQFTLGAILYENGPAPGFQTARRRATMAAIIEATPEPLRVAPRPAPAGRGCRRCLLRSRLSVRLDLTSPRAPERARASPQVDSAGVPPA